MGLGETALQEGRSKKAYEYFEKVIKQTPKHLAAHLRSARISAQEGQSKRAADHFSRVLAIDPRNQEARMGLASLRPLNPIP